jgi:sulfur carrier protein
MADDPVPSPGVALVVNGEARRFPGTATVDDVVTAVAAGPKGIAVAVNAEVVPRSAWRATALRDGDHIEVLTAAQGG